MCIYTLIVNGENREAGDRVADHLQSIYQYGHEILRKTKLFRNISWQTAFLRIWRHLSRKGANASGFAALRLVFIERQSGEQRVLIPVTSKEAATMSCSLTVEIHRDIPALRDAWRNFQGEARGGPSIRGNGPMRGHAPPENLVRP